MESLQRARFRGCPSAEPTLCSSRKAKALLLQEAALGERGWLRLYKTRLVCWQTRAKRKAFLSKSTRNFKVGPRAVFPKDNNTQICGILKLKGSSCCWLGRLLGPAQVTSIPVAVGHKVLYLFERAKLPVRPGCVRWNQTRLYSQQCPQLN